jgi:hypothetical protein
MENPGGSDPLTTELKVQRLSIRLYVQDPYWCKLLELNQLPLGYRPRPSPFGLACVVRLARIKLAAFSMSKRRAVTAPKTRYGTPSPNRTESCRRVKPMPSHLAQGACVVPKVGLEPTHQPVLKRWPLPLGYKGLLVRAGRLELPKPRCLRPQGVPFPTRPRSHKWCRRLVSN